MVTNLQHVDSREVDPLKSVVLSATQVSGGSAHNIIPGEVEVSGTVRSFDEDARERVAEAMERIAGHVAAAHKASCSFEYQRGYRPVVNDEGIAASVEEAVREVLGEDALADASPFMAGDDFSAYQQVVPGVYFFVGAGNEEKGITAPHHSADLDIDEDALQTGVEVFVHATARLLEDVEQEDRTQSLPVQGAVGLPNSCASSIRSSRVSAGLPTCLNVSSLPRRRRRFQARPRPKPHRSASVPPCHPRPLPSRRWCPPR